MPPSEYDLVIVGSGAGAMSAALAAHELGRTVVVLEKQERTGGSTAISGGVLWVPDNPLMAEEGVEDSYTRARTYFDAAVTYEASCTSPARREVFLKVGPRLIDFLRERGMALFRPEGWSDYYDELPGGEPRSRCLMAPLYDARALGSWAPRLARSPVGGGLPVHSHELTDLYLVWRTWAGKRMALTLLRRRFGAWLRGSDLVSNGAALQGRLLELVLARGIEVRPSTPVQELVLESGRVVGVRVTEEGSPDIREIRARDGVLLNAGGFSRNDALRRQTGRARPPFHAVPMYPSDVSTAGGLVTDEHARVLRDDASPIEGLYATGNTTASVVGRCYPGAGASISASLVFGFVAAHHASGNAHRTAAICGLPGTSRSSAA